MKKRLLIVFFSLLLSQLNAQISGIAVTGGIGSYDLKDFSLFQSNLISGLPVPLRQFNSFPPYTNLRINLFKKSLSALSYGISYAYSVTGSHANYKDFSGYINLDQSISSHQLGISASYPFLNFFVTTEKELDFSAYADIRLAYIKDYVHSTIYTSYFYENNDLKLSTISPVAELGLQATMHFNKISAGIEAGYLYDTGQKMKVGEQLQADPYFSLKPESQIKSDLSGIRLGIKLIFWFNQYFQDE